MTTLGVNDKHFRIAAIEWAEPMTGGRVVVEIGDALRAAGAPCVEIFG